MIYGLLYSKPRSHGLLMQLDPQQMIFIKVTSISSSSCSSSSIIIIIHNHHKYYHHRYIHSIDHHHHHRIMKEEEEERYNNNCLSISMKMLSMYVDNYIRQDQLVQFRWSILPLLHCYSTSMVKERYLQLLYVTVGDRHSIVNNNNDDDDNDDDATCYERLSRYT